MDLVAAENWTSTHAVIEQGFYIDGDNGQPNPSVVYCRKHAEKAAARYTRDAKRFALQIKHNFCEAWAGSDIVERCDVKSCDIALYTGGLTNDGIKWALGMEEENPISFVATVDELEMVRRAMPPNVMTNDKFQRVVPNGIQPDVYLRLLWLSQVLRNQKGVGKKQRLAFEAAWLAGDLGFALGLLQRARAA